MVGSWAGLPVDIGVEIRSGGLCWKDLEMLPKADQG